ncbi:MAG TPA: prepilin peptidase [Nitriliruptorales bacterium]|nr:prepilin peptidase [Nitriliruptorales bacterium]
MSEAALPVVLVASLLGLVFGSFANVAIHRWPRRESIVRPASRCPACGTPIRPRDNIPVVSWLLLRATCRDCGARISFRYPVVELLVGVLWGLVAAVHGVTWALPAFLLLAWALVVATLIDLEHRIIPNKLTYPLAPVTLALLLLGAAGDGSWADLRRAVVVGIALPVGMFLLSEAFRHLRGQSGMGMGDVKLAVSLGLVLGWLGGWETVIGLYATVIAAVVVAFGLVLGGRARLATRIPFGPYLAIGTLVALLAGEPLTGVVRTWIGLA